MMETKYKCPSCGAVAEIDKEKKTVTVEMKAITLQMPKIGTTRRVSSFKFPSHADCEFHKPVDEINLDLLEQVEQEFKYESHRGMPF